LISPDADGLNPGGFIAAPEFPPAFAGSAVAPGQTSFEAAAAGAAGGGLGAGDLCWSLRTDRAEAAFVLEPEVALNTAAQMLPVLMVAIGDALGAIGPPNLAITYRWPDKILANGALVGQIRMAVPAECGPDDVPDHLVTGFELNLTGADGDHEPGHDLRETFLHEEGCGDLDRTIVIEAVARHFLSWIDGWQQDGFFAAHQSWLSRAHDNEQVVEIELGGRTVSGTMLGLDETGGLLVKTGKGARVLPLHEAAIAGRAAHG
jgi:BirA family transcriptional regulator, biotin operon repressor / biotin---[acetyl-CoA-carboxylase] ligase